MQKTSIENMILAEAQPNKSLGTATSSLAELVTRQIREFIITGEFVPGQRLKEDELCRMFDISRPPIREAFKTLEANGMLVHKPRRGVFVSEFTTKDVEEVYTIIAMLYQKTTEMALEEITEQDMAALKQHLDAMAMAVGAEPHNVRDYQLAHGDFHQKIIDIAGNQRIKKLEGQLRDQVLIFSYTSFQKRVHLEASLDYHLRIYRAIRKRNKKEALRLMEEHVLKALAFLVDKMSGKADRYSGTGLVE